MPMDFIQWRIFLIEDYSATESVFVFKCNHCLADVTAQMLMLFNMQDDVNMKDMPNITSNISLCAQIIMWLILPLNIFWCSFLTVVCLPKELNGFKTPEIQQKLTKKKNAVISVDISQRVLHRKAKQMGGSINDFFMTILSISLKKYLERHAGDTQTDTIQLAVPFSLRPKPRNPMDFSFDNQFAVLPLRLRLVDSFNEGFKMLHDDMNKVKHSMTPFAMVHMHRVIMNFPSLIRTWILNDFSKRMTFTLSFVHGPSSPLTIAGSKSISQAFLACAMCTMSGGISVFSHCKNLKIGITADEAAMKHPQELMDILYQELDQVCGHDWRLS